MDYLRGEIITETLSRCRTVEGPPILRHLNKAFCRVLKERNFWWKKVVANWTHPLLAIVLLVFLVLLRLRAGGDNIAVRSEVVSIQLWLDLWQLRNRLHFYCHLVVSTECRPLLWHVTGPAAGERSVPVELRSPTVPTLRRSVVRSSQAGLDWVHWLHPAPSHSRNTTSHNKNHWHCQGKQRQEDQRTTVLT